MNDNTYLTKILETVEEIKRDMGGVKLDMSQLKRDIGEVKLDVSQLQQDISSLKEDMRKVLKFVSVENADFNVNNH